MNPTDLLTDLCAVPTAPFREHRVIEHVERFARTRRPLKLSRDRTGNLLLVRPARGRPAGPRLVFVAHLDHPGLIAGTMTDAKTLAADFHGGVLPDCLPGVRVRFFGDAETTGRILTAEPDDRGRARRVTVRVARPVSPGTLGMFDLTPGVIRGRRFHGRVCDDLAGAAAALATLDALVAKPARIDVAALLTRGEEQGFIGALAAVESRELLRRDDRLVSIECSAEQPVARQGHGVVVRVGDRTSVFHSAFTRFLTTVATDLAAEGKAFQYQRALMPGGTCEATVFDAWGYKAAAACVPLGNYHNMDKVRRKIAAEYVHLDDWANMVKFFVALARRAHQFDGTHAEIKATLTKRLDEFRGLLHAGS